MSDQEEISIVKNIEIKFSKATLVDRWLPIYVTLAGTLFDLRRYISDWGPSP